MFLPQPLAHPLPTLLGTQWPNLGGHNDRVLGGVSREGRAGGVNEEVQGSLPTREVLYLALQQ